MGVMFFVAGFAIGLIGDEARTFPPERSRSE
jgi:hypothetical protein